MEIGIIIAAVLISFAIGVPVGIAYRKKKLQNLNKRSRTRS